MDHGPGPWSIPDVVDRLFQRAMNLTPYIALRFNGQCGSAFKFYERCLGAKIVFILTWGNSPMAAQAPPGWGEKILHARITVGGTDLVGSDVLPEEYEPPRGFSVILEMNKHEEAERVFQALAENGTVHVPIQKTFWASLFGSLVDQFGIPWDINCEEPQ
jgi:PhnB protein